MNSNFAPPALVLLDIEGTTAPVSFVHDVLFPYARQAMASVLSERADDPAVRHAIAEIGRIAPGVEPLTQLLAWMDRDEKIAPLKALQGIAWQVGYEKGELVGELYPDVLPALRAWKAAGSELAVYSSGSETAQRLIYGHTTEGDQTGLFSAFFDLRVGGKRDAQSYEAIARQSGLDPVRILFLSDVEAELDAADDAGLRTAQIVRPQDGTVAGTRHVIAANFEEVARHFNLPHQA